MLLRIMALLITYLEVGHGFYETNALYVALGPAVFYSESIVTLVVLYTGAVFAVTRLRLHPIVLVALILTFVLCNAYDALGDLSLVWWTLP